MPDGGGSYAVPPPIASKLKRSRLGGPGYWSADVINRDVKVAGPLIVNELPIADVTSVANSEAIGLGVA